MSIYFLDSSALVKRYISETGSNWVCNLFDPSLGNQFFITAIAGVEMVSAITRRAKTKYSMYCKWSGWDKFCFSRQQLKYRRIG